MFGRYEVINGEWKGHYCKIIDRGSWFDKRTLEHKTLIIELEQSNWYVHANDEDLKLQAPKLIGINLNEDGTIKHDDNYDILNERRRFAIENRTLAKKQREEAEEARRAALTPKERLKEDIEIEIRSSEEFELDFDTLAEMFKRYNELE